MVMLHRVVLAVYCISSAVSAFRGEKTASRQLYRGQKSLQRSLGHDEGYCNPGMMETCAPTNQPSVSPSESPTLSFAPTLSIAPSAAPSQTPTLSSRPSAAPSATPTLSFAPTLSAAPSAAPSGTPSASPSSKPSSTPSVAPSLSSAPSTAPSSIPSSSPSGIPSAGPSGTPSVSPSAPPTTSVQPTASPSASPTFTPAPTGVFETETIERSSGTEYISTCREGVSGKLKRETATFDYILNIPAGANFNSVIRELELELQLELADQYLICDADAPEEPFFVETISSFPVDTASKEACEPEEIIDECYVINGIYRADILYSSRRRLFISDDNVFAQFNDTLTKFFNQELPLASGTVDLRYRGIYNKKPKEKKGGKIAGSILGVLFFLLILLLLLRYCIKRRKQEREGHKVLEDDGGQEEDEMDLMQNIEEETLEERTKAILVGDEESTIATLPKIERKLIQEADPFFVPVDDLPGEEAVQEMQTSIEEELGPEKSIIAAEKSHSDTVVF